MMWLFSKKRASKPNVTDKDRVKAWAYHNCERENAKWLGTDPENICPLRGNCPRCQEEAKKVIYGND